MSTIKQNIVAILSLLFIFLTFIYSAWRFERSESNQNIRAASFEVLKNLGELQQVVNQSYFAEPKMDPMVGWGHMILVYDLSQILPEPIPQLTDELYKTWSANFRSLKEDEKAVDQVSSEIDQSRKAILKVLERLK